jgi:hypothetical protein
VDWLEIPVCPAPPSLLGVIGFPWLPGVHVWTSEGPFESAGFRTDHAFLGSQLDLLLEHISLS